MWYMVTKGQRASRHTRACKALEASLPDLERARKSSKSFADRGNY